MNRVAVVACVVLALLGPVVAEPTGQERSTLRTIASGLRDDNVDCDAFTTAMETLQTEVELIAGFACPDDSLECGDWSAEQDCTSDTCGLKVATRDCTCTVCGVALQLQLWPPCIDAGNGTCRDDDSKATVELKLCGDSCPEDSLLKRLQDHAAERDDDKPPRFLRNLLGGGRRRSGGGRSRTGGRRNN